jgi:hypothetical protein
MADEGSVAFDADVGAAAGFGSACTAALSNVGCAVESAFSDWIGPVDMATEVRPKDRESERAKTPRRKRSTQEWDAFEENVGDAERQVHGRPAS